MKIDKMFVIFLINCFLCLVFGATDTDTDVPFKVRDDRNGSCKTELLSEITSLKQLVNQEILYRQSLLSEIASLRQLVNQESLFRQELERQVREVRQQGLNDFTPKTTCNKNEISNATDGSSLNSVINELENIFQSIEAKNIQIEKFTNLVQSLNISVANIAKLSQNTMNGVSTNRSQTNQEVTTTSSKIQDDNKDGQDQSHKTQVTKVGNIGRKYGKGHMGKSFAIMVPTGVSGRNMPIHLIISSQSNTLITMTSSYPGLSRVFNVTAPGENITLPADFALQQNENGLAQSRGIILESTEFVSVYVFHEDGYFAIPTRYLGTYYKSLTTDNGYSFFAIMPHGGCAIVDVKSSSGVSNRTIYIPERTAYYLWSSSSFRNVMVTSNQTIAVISGHVRSFTGKKQTIYDSILPVQQWNKSYIIPYIQNTTSTYVKYDFYYSTSKTTASSMRNCQRKQITINLPYTYIASGKTVSTFIQTSQTSISVVLWHYQGSVFNSFMCVVPALSQFSNNYQFWTPFYSNNNFLAAIIKEEDKNGLILDNSTVTNPYMSHSVCTLDKVTYRVLTIRVSHGWHSVKHCDPGVRFGLIMYGGDLNVAYGLPLGLRLD